MNNLEGLENLVEIKNNFLRGDYMSGQQIDNISSLKNLKEVLGSINIHHTSIKTLDGLNNLENVENILFYDNELLDNYCAIIPFLL